MSYYEKVEPRCACLEQCSSSSKLVMLHVLHDHINLMIFQGAEYMMLGQAFLDELGISRAF